MSLRFDASADLSGWGSGSSELLQHEGQSVSRENRGDSEPTLAELYFTPCIKLHVGHGAKEFQAHEGLLRSKVPFFRKALEGSFKEATKGEINLPEDDPEVFGLFLLWLYNGLSAEELLKHQKLFHLKHYIGLYVLADKWCCPALQNTVITILADWFENFNEPCVTQLREFVTASYASIGHLTKLRKFLASSCVTLAVHSDTWTDCILLQQLCTDQPSLSADIGDWFCNALTSAEGMKKHLKQFSRVCGRKRPKAPDIL